MFPASKPDNLSLVSGLTEWKERTDSIKLSPDFYIDDVAHTHSHPHTHIDR